jgi:Orsellinic acid/F9775 biosynthesis cluster protein D
MAEQPIPAQPIPSEFEGIFLYLHTYRALICLRCNTAVGKARFRDHLTRHHKAAKPQAVKLPPIQNPGTQKLQLPPNLSDPNRISDVSVCDLV